MIEDAISFNNITKVYKLYKNNRERFKSIFFGRAIYKEKKAIDGISFSVKKGESVAILGKNGAGKSTLLKMITGVHYLSSLQDLITNLQDVKIFILNVVLWV